MSLIVTKKSTSPILYLVTIYFFINFFPFFFHAIIL